MKLPNREKAYVKDEKIINYLLSSTHPVGKHKAAFFTSIGFSIVDVEVFKNTLLQIARHNEATEIKETDFGTKYVIDGIIQAPNGKEYLIRTVWMLETLTTSAYLVTAYPL